MKINQIGVDIAKSVSHVHAIDRHGKALWQAKLKRDEWIAAACERAEPGTEVGMETCASAHHWGRELQKAWPANTTSLPRNDSVNCAGHCPAGCKLFRLR